MNKLLLYIFLFSAFILILITYNESKRENINDLDKKRFGFEGWSTNFQQSIQKSQETNRNILMVFTGSDWCPPCKTLGRKVFASEYFKEYAKSNLELLVLDFPRSTELSEAQIQHNRTLADSFHVNSFPTIIILNANGKEKGRISYFGELAEKFIERYEEKMKTKDINQLDNR